MEFISKSSLSQGTPDSLFVKNTLSFSRYVSRAISILNEFKCLKLFAEGRAVSRVVSLTEFLKQKFASISFT